MNTLILYTRIFLVVFTCFSCNKSHETEHKTAAINSSEKQLRIVVSPELFAAELHKIKADSSKITLKHKDSVLAFYQIRNGAPAWESIKNRNALYIAIKEADKEGLIPEDYNLKKLEAAVSSVNYSANYNIGLDILFTDTYLTYAYHLANGKLNPKELYSDWDLDKNQFSYNNLLNQSVNNESILKSLHYYKPSHRIYQQLKNKLPEVKSRIGSDSLRTIVAQGPKIRPNSSSQRIISIRKRLNELGYLEDSLVNNSKVLDTLLQAQLKRFQLEKQLQVDAIVGAGTINALNRTQQDNYYSILADLERWRWYPRNYGKTAIVVNIPNYQLNYYSNEDTLTHNIVVGKTARKTPVFSSVVRHIDFNPLWYIPPTIKKEDIIPSASRDINYLKKKNIAVYNKQGKKMILDSINWKSNAPYSYRYVQAAGSSNALGRLKIIFPNNFSVYLHDTPSKSLFEKNYRAKSSGCVRVQNVTNLAAKILDWPIEKINETITSKKTTRILSPKKINIHLLYWSVEFNNNSEAIFLNDVYDYDTNLGMKLAQ